MVQNLRLSVFERINLKLPHSAPAQANREQQKAHLKHDLKC